MPNSILRRIQSVSLSCQREIYQNVLNIYAGRILDSFFSELGELLSSIKTGEQEVDKWANSAEKEGLCSNVQPLIALLTVFTLSSFCCWAFWYVWPSFEESLPLPLPLM